MPEALDVYWSFRSPYSYLVTPDLLQIREDFDVDVNLRVILPIALRTKGWDQGDLLEKAVGSVGLNLDDLDKAIDDGDHLKEVEQNQKDLDAVGHWGVPTMVIRDEPFFGQDRIETLRWRMDQYGLRIPGTS